MKLVEQSFNLIELTPFPAELVEIAGRTCYKSQDKIAEGTADKMVRSLIKRGHHSVIEHAVASAAIVTDRGVSHELVRHRLASVSQQSTRYTGDSELEFIRPVWVASAPENSFTDADYDFVDACKLAELFYNCLRAAGWRREQARQVLPNALKTELIMTANLREWRHIIQLRTGKDSHPQMRDLMRKALVQFRNAVPVFFEDIN